MNCHNPECGRTKIKKKYCYNYCKERAKQICPMMPKKATKLVNRIIEDLKERAGLREVWLEIDEKIKTAIIREWVSIVEEY